MAATAAVPIRNPLRLRRRVWLFCLILIDLLHICQEVSYTIAGRMMKIKGILMNIFNEAGFSFLKKQSKYGERAVCEAP
jgi:hypothetical protein